MESIFGDMTPKYPKHECVKLDFLVALLSRDMLDGNDRLA